MPIFTFVFGFSMVKLKESLERQDCKYRRHLLRKKSNEGPYKARTVCQVNPDR